MGLPSGHFGVPPLWDRSPGLGGWEGPHPGAQPLPAIHPGSPGLILWMGSSHAVGKDCKRWCQLLALSTYQPGHVTLEPVPQFSVCEMGIKPTVPALRGGGELHELSWLVENIVKMLYLLLQLWDGISIVGAPFPPRRWAHIWLGLLEERKTRGERLGSPLYPCSHLWVPKWGHPPELAGKQAGSLSHGPGRTSSCLS